MLARCSFGCEVGKDWHFGNCIVKMQDKVEGHLAMNCARVRGCLIFFSFLFSREPWHQQAWSRNVQWGVHWRWEAKVVLFWFLDLWQNQPSTWLKLSLLSFYKYWGVFWINWQDRFQWFIRLLIYFVRSQVLCCRPWSVRIHRWAFLILPNHIEIWGLKESSIKPWWIEVEAFLQ